MRLTPLYCLPFVALLACGGPDETSEQKWSHSTISRSTATISALIAYNELGFRTNYDEVRICLQESPSYFGKSLMLESKLAYAAWLDASGRGSQQTWEHLNFSIESHCDFSDNDFASAIVIASVTKHDPTQADNFTVINCTQRNCYPNEYTTGWGGPASLSYSYSYSSPNIWSSVSMSSPSIARLSPYLQWKSLESEFELLIKALKAKTSYPNTKSNLSVSQLESLLSHYSNLKSKAETVSYAELVALNKKLATLKVDSRAPFRIVNSRDDAEQPLYQMQTAGFHTLLHEVGHQFGMMHAHVKAGFTENGGVTGTGAKLKDGFWLTDDATMAYQNSYFYLTADDKAGINDLVKKLYPYLLQRRGPKK